MWQSGKPKRLMSCLRWVASLRKLRNADRCELVCTSVRRVRASLSCLLRGLPKADHARLESITQHTRPVNIDGPSSTGRASWYRPGVTIHLEVLLDSTPSALPLAKYTVAAITYFPAVCERCSAAESGEPIAAPSGSMYVMFSSALYTAWAERACDKVRRPHNSPPKKSVRSVAKTMPQLVLVLQSHRSRCFYQIY